MKPSTISDKELEFARAVEILAEEMGIELFDFARDGGTERDSHWSEILFREVHQ